MNKLLMALIAAMLPFSVYADGEGELPKTKDWSQWASRQAQRDLRELNRFATRADRDATRARGPQVVDGTASYNGDVTATLVQKDVETRTNGKVDLTMAFAGGKVTQTGTLGTWDNADAQSRIGDLNLNGVGAKGKGLALLSSSTSPGGSGLLRTNWKQQKASGSLTAVPQPDAVQGKFNYMVDPTLKLVGGRFTATRVVEAPEPAPAPAP